MIIKCKEYVTKRTYVLISVFFSKKSNPQLFLTSQPIPPSDLYKKNKSYIQPCKSQVTNISGNINYYRNLQLQK
jgi:hypothetical protein